MVILPNHYHLCLWTDTSTPPWDTKVISNTGNEWGVNLVA